MTTARSVFVFGATLGIFLAFSFHIGQPQRASAALPDNFSGAIVCRVFTDLNAIGAPIPPLSGGTCPPNASTSTNPVLTITKVVINTGGGTKQVSDFPLFLNGMLIPSGLATTTMPGTYTVTETSALHYTGTFSGGCSSDGTVVLSLDDIKTCVLTNTFSTPTPTPTSTPHASSDLSLVKTVDKVNPTAGDSVIYTLTLHNDGPDSAADVAVTDLLPGALVYVSDDGAGSYASTTGIWTAGTIVAHADALLHITVVVGSSGSTIINRASITGSDSTDSNTTNNATSVSITSAASDDTGSSPAPSTGTGGGNGGSGSGSGNGVTSGPLSVGYSNSGGDGMVLGTTTTIKDCNQYLTGFIHTGAQNDANQVKRLQYVLHDFEGATLEVHGVYDAATLAAVHIFQAKYASDILTPWGIKNPTGYVYVTTRKKINEVYCRSTKLFPLTQQQLTEIDQFKRQIDTRAQSEQTTTGQPVAVPNKSLSASVSKGIATTSKASSAPPEGDRSWWGSFLHWLRGR